MNEQNIVSTGIKIIAAVILAVFLWPFNSVPTGYRGVITQFGAIKGIEGEGLTVLPPWQSLKNFSVRTESSSVKDVEGATKDTQKVNVSLVARYSINPDQIARVYEQYSHDGNLSSYVDSAVHESFKAVTARYTATELIEKRQEVSRAISDTLSTKLNLYGASVINIDMTGFTFEKAYMDAINAKVQQEQLKLGADNKLKTVESEQKQKVAIAEAERDAQKAKADGEAYQRKTLAEAEATALKIQNDALKQSQDILELRRIEVEKVKAEKWDGKLPGNIYAGAPIPFLNVVK